MDKLERYLDQVCRGIGGPRSLRQHIRQELREHLLDAVADHVRAGMSNEESLARALEEFGGPDQVRSELADMHGQRLLAVVVDKTLEWKERTMKARWLWGAWALIALVGLVAMEALYILFGVVYLVPKFEKLAVDGVFDDPIGSGAQSFMSWAHSFLEGLSAVMRHTTWCLLGVVVIWGLFEWRIRSENKPFMRLSALGTAAAGLMVVVVLMSAALLLPFMIVVPGLNTRLPDPIVRDQLARFNDSLPALQQALAKKDWQAMHSEARKAAEAMYQLSRLGAAAPTILSLDEQAKVDQLRTQLKAARDALSESNEAIMSKDLVRLEAALKRLHMVHLPASVDRHSAEMKM
jgi:hypothetical protein